MHTREAGATEATAKDQNGTDIFQRIEIMQGYGMKGRRED